MVSRNLERANENDGFKMTALANKLQVVQLKYIEIVDLLTTICFKTIAD